MYNMYKGFESRNKFSWYDIEEDFAQIQWIENELDIKSTKFKIEHFLKNIALLQDIPIKDFKDVLCKANVNKSIFQNFKDILDNIYSIIIELNSFNAIKQEYNNLKNMIYSDIFIWRKTLQKK